MPDFLHAYNLPKMTDVCVKMMPYILLNSFLWSLISHTPQTIHSKLQLIPFAYYSRNVGF